MEQTRGHWVWSRRKLIGGLPRIQRPFAPSSMAAGPYDSWEEQAFAEDAAGGLGGCVWPPRSYSCSFCRREFRSAQALGGHMNVHRRDRARLKQSPPVADRPVLENRLSSHPLQYHPCPQAHICPLVRNPNPNHGVEVSSSTPITLPSNPENCENRNHLSFSAPSLIIRTQTIPEQKLGGVDLSLGMTTAKRARDSCHEQQEEEDEEEGWNVDQYGSGKRQRSTADEGLHSFLDPKPTGHCLRLRIEATEHDPGGSNTEELDLELRLGDQPKLKENCREYSSA